MEQEAFARYLSDRYDDQVDWYDGKAASNQKVYRWMQWTLIVLAAITPILIELDLESFGWFKWATLTSAIVAILTAGMKTFKYQENWINYRTTCETLRKERYYYEAGVGDYEGAEDREALFVERVEDLISRENTLWISAHRQKTKPEKPGTKAGG